MKYTELLKILFTVSFYSCNLLCQNIVFAISSNSSKDVLMEKTDKLLLPTTEEEKFACIANCEEKIARVEKEETINSYVFSDTIRICGPAANEKTAEWMEKTINEGWSAPDIYYKGKNMIVDVTVIYDQKINCTNHFANFTNIENLTKNSNKSSDTVIRLFYNDLIKEKIERHDDYNFANGDINIADGTLGYASACSNYAELSLIAKGKSKNSNHINKYIVIHEFGHLLCLKDTYGKAHSFVYDKDIMNNSLMDNSQANIKADKKNIIEVISIFDCFRENMKKDNSFSGEGCEVRSPYNDFDICLEKETTSSINFFAAKCNNDATCALNKTIENKSKILKACNKFLPNL